MNTTGNWTVNPATDPTKPPPVKLFDTNLSARSAGIVTIPETFGGQHCHEMDAGIDCGCAVYSHVWR